MFTLVEPNRQLERKGLGRTGYPPKISQDTCLVQQKRGEKNTKDMLQQLLEHRNTNKQRPANKITQPKRRNNGNNLDLQVVPSPDHNSDGPLPNLDEARVVLPQQKREDNPSKSNTQEVEPSAVCDLPPSLTSNREETEISARLQRRRWPPAWFGDFVTGGELELSLTSNQGLDTHLVNRITMAQKQLEKPPPLEIT